MVDVEIYGTVARLGSVLASLALHGVAIWNGVETK